MAHFAKTINNTVTQVIVIGNDDCGGGVFPESEPIGQAYIASLLIDGLWLQTSYSNSFRNCFAGVGYRFLSNAGEYGEFVPPVLTDAVA